MTATQLRRLPRTAAAARLEGSWWARCAMSCRLEHGWWVVSCSCGEGAVGRRLSEALGHAYGLHQAAA